MKLSTTSILAACFSVGALSATPITWTFGSGSLLNVGQSLTRTQGGVSLTMTSWSLATQDGTFAPVSTGQYGGGLGVCDAGERTAGCPSNDHAVDNNGQYNFALFQFSSAVDPTSMLVNVYRNANGLLDSDVTYWTGNISTSTTILNGISQAGLAGLGFANGPQSDDTTGGLSSRSIALTSPGYVNALLLGASTTSYGKADHFKIRSLTAHPNPVPEPATFALLGAGLIGLGIAVRRRKA